MKYLRKREKKGSFSKYTKDEDLYLSRYENDMKKEMEKLTKELISIDLKYNTLQEIVKQLVD